MARFRPACRLAAILFLVLCCAFAQAQNPNQKTAAAWYAKSAGVTLPPGFVAQSVAAGITGATALEILPDGRVLICQQTGELLVFKDGKLLPGPMLKLKVDPFWERGLLGAAADPAFASNGFLYLYYISPDPFPHHVLSRFTVTGDTADPASEKILLEGDDQTKTNTKSPGGHMGGAPRFGTDGKLYLPLGEQVAGAPAQDLHSILGKVLRINPDGTIPADNPFYNQTEGKYRAIWATGCRNPFALAVQKETGRIYLNDVGGVVEEINECAPGKNYGWPVVEHGPTTDPRFTGPVHFYPVNSIVGGDFCPMNSPLPAEYRGKYFFMDFKQGWVRYLDPAKPQAAEEFAAGFQRPVDLRFAPDGSICVLIRDMWVNDKQFKPATGSLFRITYDPAHAPQQTTTAPVLPDKLSELGLSTDFDLYDDNRGPGIRPYQIIAPQWLDGAYSKHWFSLPEGGKITISPDQPWQLPPGTKLVQLVFDVYFDGSKKLGLNRLEYRVLIMDSQRRWHAGSYRLQPDGKDAELQKTPIEVAFKREGLPDFSWRYMTQDECLACHNAASGGALTFRKAQWIGIPLNNEKLFANPIVGHSSVQEFIKTIEDYGSRSELVAQYGVHFGQLWPDLSKHQLGQPSIERRARSYLDVNCSNCHRPNGNIPAQFDARFTTPLDQAKMIDAPTVTDIFNLGKPKVIAPGDPQRSVLYLRMMQTTPGLRMPLVGSHVVDPQGTALIKQWIESMKK